MGQPALPQGLAGPPLRQAGKSRDGGNPSTPIVTVLKPEAPKVHNGPIVSPERGVLWILYGGSGTVYSFSLSVC
jgi:hypothetical protein